MKKLLLSLSLALCASAALQALDVKEGRMKLVLYEDSGRFNLYWLQDLAKEKYLPLLFERDPRTSSLMVLVDNKMYRLGESVEFRTSVQKLPDGAALVFRSSFLVVTESFSFIRSVGAPLADGVKVSLTVENISERDLSVGIRYLLDTYLGERSAAHFITSLKPKVATETRIDSASKDEWIVSPSPDRDDAGLMVMVRHEDQLSPDSFIMANWSRIDSSPWLYDFNQTRSFTLQPYSINDSAIAVTWEARTVPRAGKREAVLLMGNRSAQGFTQTEEASATAAIFDSTVLSGGSAETKAQAIQMDLLAVRDLLDDIDSRIASGKDASQEDIAVLQRIIESLKARKAAYQD